MEQLKLMMQYTIFHAGVYITLGGLMIALVGMNAFASHAPAMLPYLISSLGCFLVAGFCSGIIASNIPYYDDFAKFKEARIGPWIAPRLVRAWLCMSIEHTMFWIGVGIFLLGFCVNHLWSAPPVTPPAH